MKRMTKWLLGGLLAMMLASTALAADLRKGLEAFGNRDYITALAELTPLAEAGDANAQFLVGLIYAAGRQGAPPDTAEAAKWFRLAAEDGYIAAQFWLARMYVEGEGVPQDDRFAYMWFNLAAAQGSEKASENRNILADIMTPARLAEAQEMSRRCLEQNYKDC